MKKILFVLLLLTAHYSFAVTFDIDGIRYEIISKTDHTVSVAIIPKSITYPTYSTYTGDFIIPAQVEFNGTMFDVIGIGKNAFSECRSLGTITLPQSIKFIDFAAFSYSNIEELALPDGLETIGAAAFRDSYIKELTIPESLKNLGTTTFANCRYLTKVHFLTDKILEIPDDAFSGCSSLETVNIPESVTSIGAYAFRETTILSDISLPTGVTKIGNYCFYKSGITSIIIPEGVTELDGQMFYGCRRLKNIKLPVNLKFIGEQLFRDCQALETISIPNAITTIPEYCFRDCFALKDVTFPTSLTSIDKSAFSDCRSLVAITLPEGLKTIGNEAFFNCKITALNLPSTLESVGGWAFGLGDTKELILPAALKKIGSYAFDDTQLERVVCLNPTPCECEENIFKNETYLYATLQVPKESLELYKLANPWKNFFKIEESSGIEEVKETVDLTVKNYISTNGVISEKPIKGINIIQFKDGSTRKVIIR